MNRKLYIDKSIMKKCNGNNNMLLALALMLCIKRDFVNSVLYDYTTTKLMAICHGNHHAVKTALETAFQIGYVTSISYKDKKKEHKNLSVKKLRSINEKQYFQFFVTENKTGDKILYFKSTEKDINSKSIAQNTCGPQTFKQVCGMIMFAISAKVIRRQNKFVDAYAATNGKTIAESMRRVFGSPVFKATVTPVNSGISYDKLAKRTKIEGMSRWKMIRLIKQMKEMHLIDFEHNQIALANFTPGLFYDENDHKRLERALLHGEMDWDDHYSGKRVNSLFHTYTGKNETACMFFRRLGNSYKLTSSILVYNRRRLKVRKENGNS